jgi:hypothetical protein
MDETAVYEGWGKTLPNEGYGLQQAAEKLCFVSGHDFSRAVND